MRGEWKYFQLLNLWVENRRLTDMIISNTSTHDVVAEIQTANKV